MVAIYEGFHPGWGEASPPPPPNTTASPLPPPPQKKKGEEKERESKRERERERDGWEEGREMWSLREAISFVGGVREREEKIIEENERRNAICFT